MNKKFKLIILSVIAVVLFSFAFAACDTTEEKTFTVSFIADGKVVKTVETKGNEVIELLEAPEKQGYEFAGWFLDRWQWQKPFDGNNFADQKLTADVKVYAYYKESSDVNPDPEKYDITFYADGKGVETVKSAGNEAVRLN